MSSRFLARGHNNRGVSPFSKAYGKDQGVHAAKPPVSKVRPMMESNLSRSQEDKTPVSPVSTGGNEGPNREDAPERDCPPTLRPAKKKKTLGSHLWRLSNPPSRAPLLLDRGTGLQKSHSAQNLASDSLRSPVPSSDHIELCKRPQQLFLDHDAPRPSFHFSSPSTCSPQSPQSPLPWDSPKLRPQHSYMNPTASSMAKSSRSSSLGDGIQIGTPPCSPSFTKARKSCGDGPLLTSSPVTVFPSSVSSVSSLIPVSGLTSPPHPHPTATVSPTHSVPPSRIPLPKLPLGPRRSLCLEVMPSSGWSGPPTRASTPSTDLDMTPGLGNKQALCRHLSLNLDPSLPSSLPVKQKRDSVVESAKEPAGQVAAARDDRHTPSTDPLPDDSITLETCRQAVTELHSSLRKTVMLYTTLLQSDQHLGEDQQEMKRILSDTLLTVKTELDSLPHPADLCEGPRLDQGRTKVEGEKALALLEQYAELLLKSVERRLDTKT